MNLRGRIERLEQMKTEDTPTVSVCWDVEPPPPPAGVRVVTWADIETAMDAEDQVDKEEC